MIIRVQTWIPCSQKSYNNKVCIPISQKFHSEAVNWIHTSNQSKWDYYTVIMLTAKLQASCVDNFYS